MLCYLIFSRPFHGLRLPFGRWPSDESLGYYHSSANADLFGILFGQSEFKLYLVGTLMSGIVFEGTAKRFLEFA